MRHSFQSYPTPANGSGQLGTHPTERKLLLLSNAMVLQVFGNKNSIIRMVWLDSESLITRHWFKSLGTLNGFVSIVGILSKIKDLATGMIHKQTTACISHAFSSKCMQEATVNRRKIVKSGNTITMSKMIGLELESFRERARCHHGQLGISLTFPPPFFSYSPTGSTWLRHGVQFCQYQAYMIGGMATTRRGGYRIAVLAFYWGRSRGGSARKKLDKKIIQFLSVELTCADLVGD